MRNTTITTLAVTALLTACNPDKGASPEATPAASSASDKAKSSAPEEAAPPVETAKPEAKSGPVVDEGSVQPGTAITKKGVSLTLTGTPVEVGKPMPDIALKDAVTGDETKTSSLAGKVAIISIVPSVKTPVCEAQTHLLGEKPDDTLEGVVRVTVSRDSAADLKSFSEEAKLSNITYLSDRALGAFGPATGLGVKEADILARAVIVVDQTGTVRYLQVVPEVTHLPDMNKAFEKATELAKEAASK
jgi:thioredoxin-dependent peroxiredoxin